MFFAQNAERISKRVAVAVRFAEIKVKRSIGHL